MTAACPKAMVHGPCGGVSAAGRCELGDRDCTFLEGPLAVPPAPTVVAEVNAAAGDLLAVLDDRPLVVAELPPGARDERAVAAALAGHVDAALLGDAPWARVHASPVVRVQRLLEEGVRPWASLTCRDRNRVALEGELAGLEAIGAGAVHCLTGDHPAIGHRPDAAAVFDLDAPRLAALAAGTGMLVSVAEAPAAPPRRLRALRAAGKAQAGADVLFVNHATVDEVAAFLAELRPLAPELRCIACVPLAASPAGLERLAAYLPGGAPPAEAVAALEARDPVGAAVRAAVAHAGRLLAIEGVDGVDLSAAAGPGEELQVAAALALAALELGGGT